MSQGTAPPTELATAMAAAAATATATATATAMLGVQEQQRPPNPHMAPHMNVNMTPMNMPHHNMGGPGGMGQNPMVMNNQYPQVG